MITGINEYKTLTKHISYQCKYQFDGRNFNSDQWWNNDKYWCKRKKRHAWEKNYFWNPSTCSCENGKYLASIMDNLTITCDEIRDVEGTSCIEKKRTCKTQCFLILLVSLWITIALLIAVSIYSYLTKYQKYFNKNIDYHFNTKN